MQFVKILYKLGLTNLSLQDIKKYYQYKSISEKSKTSTVNQTTHVTGTVQWFDQAKGYGFISSEDGDDVFVHFSAINLDGYRGLKQGQTVKFDIKRGDKGLEASNVEQT